MSTPLRPTGIIGWGSSGISTEPTDEKKGLGWGATGASGERPPAEYFNWLQQQNEAWQRYLSYERIIDDDWLINGVNTPAGGNPQPTGTPDYYGVGRSGAMMRAVGGPGTFGVLNAQDPVGSGYCSTFKYVGYGFPNDFFFASTFSLGPQNGSYATGFRPFFGINIGATTYGATNCCGFGTSGTTGAVWSFIYGGGSGMSSYSQEFSIHPTLRSTTGYQALTIEKRGATLIASINCPLSGYEERYAAVAEQFNPAVFCAVGFGGQFYGVAPSWGYDSDYLRFGVRRR